MSVIHASRMSSEALVTEPLLDEMMISEHPVIIQIKTLLSEAKQVAAVAKAALKRASSFGPKSGGRIGRPLNAEQAPSRRRNNHP